MGPLVPAAWFIRSRHLDRWLFHDLLRQREPVVAFDQPQHVFIAVCDHYEPEWGAADSKVAMGRVNRWCHEYPRLFSEFRDSAGNPPRHTFFFPQDEYRPEYLDALAELCGAGYGEVEIHIHHDGDTAETLTEKLLEFRDTLAFQHGLLHRDPESGHPVYGFIHGNWALCNSRPDGRWCGVPDELNVLRATGCYADFTMPSAPSNTQTSLINSIYYARNQPGRNKSHDQGVLAAVGRSAPPDSLLMVQGALCLDWSDRKWGVFPRIENSDLHRGRPPARSRLAMWHQCGVHVQGRPDWVFIKLHTHGCKPGNIEVMLGDAMRDLHLGLRSHADQHPGFKFHYVTAWEMTRFVHQAEQGRSEPDWSAIRSEQNLVMN